MKEITRTDWQNLPVGYLSPTQVWDYISCPACYEASRILRIPKPMSADLMVGRYAHAALAHMRSLFLIENKEPVFEQSVEVGSEAFDRVISEQIDRDETGEETPVEIELTKKYTDLGAAKDVAAKLTRYALPLIAKWDLSAGVVATEARVRHLGTPLYGTRAAEHATPAEIEDWKQEAEEQFVDGVEPCFPFAVRAYLDVLYANASMKDAKTAGKLGSPGTLAALQLLMYGMPWWMAGEPQKLGWDVLVKTKNPNFAVYWINGTGDVTDEQYRYARWRVLAAADGICNGDFPPNDGSLFCKYDHGLPKGERAAMEDWAVPA
ncbi:MAG: PD-(D/E)XK nuclease family protein [Solirubrobacterales bacterium]